MRLHIAQGRFDQAARALRPAIEQAQQRGRLRRKLKLRLLYALALDGMGQHAAAMEALSGVLPFASEEGWRSTFVEEGACLATLLQRWAQTRGFASAIAPGFVGDLLKRFAVTGHSPSMASVAALTEREHQVLRLLAQGRQVSAIALGLQLSGHTVKAHLRNIYRKLGAHGQVEAAAIARARGLLDDPHEHSCQNARRPGPHHRLGSPGHPQFAVDVLDMRLDRVGRDVQAFADLPV
ncbi:LuxR family transcriptional regulator, maltose regulon positive regulatory protein [Pseudomonas sp. IT-P74]